MPASKCPALRKKPPENHVVPEGTLPCLRCGCDLDPWKFKDRPPKAMVPPFAQAHPGHGRERERGGGENKYKKIGGGEVDSCKLVLQKLGARALCHVLGAVEIAHHLGVAAAKFPDRPARPPTANAEAWFACVDLVNTVLPTWHIPCRDGIWEGQGPPRNNWFRDLSRFET